MRLSRPARRLLIEIGVVRDGRFVVVQRTRISGRRVVVPVRLPAGRPVRARIVVE